MLLVLAVAAELKGPMLPNSYTATFYFAVKCVLAIALR
jgi:hypothetical protein